MQMANIITLTTDFGLEDSYVGQLKGTILKGNPQACIVDISHSIPAQDILTAAVTIRGSYNAFPEGSIHLIIVDPGVGSKRRIIAASSAQHLFIAPDNGTLSLLLRDNIIQSVHLIENHALFAPQISNTFHGRDIMAPVAAALADGLPLEQVGASRPIDSCVQLELPDPVINAAGIEGQVLQIDHFGNIRTNITLTDLNKFADPGLCKVILNGHQIDTISNTYSGSLSGSLVALIDSSGYLEIAVNMGSAARFTTCSINDSVTVLLEKGRASVW